MEGGRLAPRYVWKQMEYISKNYTVSLINESDYSLNSVDNIRSYSIEYLFDDHQHNTSKHGLSVRDELGNNHDCILIAGGGASGVHENSLVVVDDRCFVAVGDHIVALSLPNLDKLWAKKLDEATCFGVYYMKNIDCLIIHGELEISRVSIDGIIYWSSSGKDIFTEGIELFEDHVEAVDFNMEKYSINIESGKSEIITT